MTDRQLKPIKETLAGHGGPDNQGKPHAGICAGN